VEDGALAGLAGASGPDRSDQADAVLAGDLLLERDREVAAVDEVLLRQQVPILQVGQDAGQGLGVVDGGLVVVTSVITYGLSWSQVSVTCARKPFQRVSPRRA
jgi:hypothetical protein